MIRLTSHQPSGFSSGLFQPYEATGQPPALARSRGHTRASPRLTRPLYKAVVCGVRQKQRTPEVEAKVAIFRASRLMGQYNVTQAEILAHEPLSTQRNYAGQSVVSIVRSDGNLSKSVKHQGYVDQLCWAMNEFFDCKHYSTSYTHCVELKFYGIAQNTVTAALSFEIINKAAELAEAKATEDQAIKAKVKQKEIERQAQLDRLAPHVGEQVNLCSPEPEPELAYENTHSDVDSDDMTIYEDAYDVIDDDSNDEVEPDFKIEDEDIYNSLDLGEEILSFVSNNPQSTMQASGLSAAAPATNTQELSVPAQNVIASTDPDAEQDEAAIMQQEALKKLQRILGDDHADTITAMSTLANMLGHQGSYDEAACMQQKVLEKRQRILGDEHPDTIVVMHNLAVTLSNQGKLNEATILHEVLEKQMRILEGEHSDTSTAMYNLTITAPNPNRGAERIFEEALQKSRVTLDGAVNKLAIEIRYEACREMWMASVNKCG
ncbi:hypothetical protein V497_00446 [Pseudogymnoascus sp. VKM F-4516 (FW-969)]|nr:hypothetical protein V497_00446 [Pseudogymnoascus sp. VKM F-4516 (FW-969)]